LHYAVTSRSTQGHNKGDIFNVIRLKDGIRRLSISSKESLRARLSPWHLKNSLKMIKFESIFEL